MSTTCWLIICAVFGFICFMAGWLFRGRKEDRLIDLYPAYSRGMFDPEDRIK